ncbi:MAG: uroporphyrinogen decarboxylase family protein [Verrucomicrobiia bacterium]|jgi:uroporphyrinogen decarboxylase
MDRREIVRRAIEFEHPPRLPFWQHWNHKLPEFPDDVCNIWEMDRAEAGWFFDKATMDDWGCGWSATDLANIGQVKDCPLDSWSALDCYRPPNPRNPFYYDRLGPLIDAAGDRYVVLTAHSLLFSRLHKLRGFAATMEDFYLEPERVHRVLDMIVDFKVQQCLELKRRFGDRIHGLFVTDDWGTQAGPFIGQNLFDEFFAPRYRIIFDAIHACGWHVILHSCGRVNALVPSFLNLGADVLNMQQSRSYGLVEFGEQFRGKICFLATVDIQSTMPRGVEPEIREETRLLARHWRTAEGGLIVFDYGAWEAVGVSLEAPRVMFDEFAKLQTDTV